MPRKPNTTGSRYYDPFPSRLRDLIRERDVRQEDLITALGVSTRQSVTGYTDGSTLPTPDKIVALANFFCVSTDYLLGVTDSRSTDTELRAICDYTGLTDAAVEALHSGLGFPTQNYRKAGYHLLNKLLSSESGIGNVLRVLLDAISTNKACLKRLEERDVNQGQFNRFRTLNSIRKDVVSNKYDATEIFGEFYDSITGYKDAKAAIEAAINQELQK